MLSLYQIESGKLEACSAEDATVFLYSQPSDAEREEIQERSGLDKVDLESIHDPDEVPRIESSSSRTLIIWKKPDNLSVSESVHFEVSSLGLVLFPDRLILIVPNGKLQMTGRDFRNLESPEDLAIRVLMHTIHHYQGHLKAIKMMSRELQEKVAKSMENRYLLQMFALGESLVYYHNALEANLTVLSRLRNVTERLRLTAEQVNLLDDVIIENQQASRQAGIYSTVLSGLMDARGTIVNNNMNVLLKNLTLINIVFLPLNLIASIWGMSEWTVITEGIDWRISYGLFALGMVVLGWLTWKWLIRIIDKNHE